MRRSGIFTLWRACDQIGDAELCRFQSQRTDNRVSISQDAGVHDTPYMSPDNDVAGSDDFAAGVHIPQYDDVSRKLQSLS